MAVLDAGLFQQMGLQKVKGVKGPSGFLKALLNHLIANYSLEKHLSPCRFSLISKETSLA